MKELIFALWLLLVTLLGAVAQTLSGVTISGQVAVGTNYTMLTNSFAFRLHNDVTNAEGTAVTTTLLTNATWKIINDIPGAWSMTANAGDALVWTTNAQFALPSPFTFGNYRYQSDGGTKGLAINYRQYGGALDQSIRYTFTQSYSNISFGFWFRNFLTNSTDLVYWDLVDFRCVDGTTSDGVVQYLSGPSPRFQTETLSNSVTCHGGPIVGTGSSLIWITGNIVQNGNYSMAVYDSSLVQISTNSVSGVGNAPIDRVFIAQTYGHNVYQDVTNYMDNFIISTNGTFPLLPNAF